MAQRDLIVSFLSAVPPSVLSQFDKPPLQAISPVSQSASANWPGGRPGYRAWLGQFKDADGGVIKGLAIHAGAKTGDTIGRVCVLGFSNGCVGVDELLRASDSAKVDTVLAIDGIHGAYAGKDKLHPGSYKRWLNHGVGVVRQDPEYDPNAPVMVVTHSSIRPPGFPSTTETADYIWQMVMSKAPGRVVTPGCGYDCPPAIHESNLLLQTAPVQACSQGQCFTWDGIADGWYDRRIANNFYVLGWGQRHNGAVTTKDPRGYADHVFQGKYVLPLMLEEFCVKRWRRDCEPVAVIGVGTLVGFGGLGDPVSCKLEQGIAYSHSDAGKVDYFPEIAADTPPVPAPTCPPPEPGAIIVGSPSDPCATHPPRTPAPGAISGWGYAAAVAGVATGLWATRAVVRRWSA